jgi:hypothetical protein
LGPRAGVEVLEKKKFVVPSGIRTEYLFLSTKYFNTCSRQIHVYSLVTIDGYSTTNLANQAWKISGGVFLYSASKIAVAISPFKNVYYKGGRDVCTISI